MPTAGRHRAVLRTGACVIPAPDQVEDRLRSGIQSKGFSINSLDSRFRGNGDVPLSAIADALARRSSAYLACHKFKLAGYMGNLSQCYRMSAPFDTIEGHIHHSPSSTSTIMKFFFLFAMFVAALGTVGSVLAQQRSGGPIGAFVFDQAANLSVVAIDESPGRTMNAATFASADPAVVKKFMPDGTAPASMSSFVLFAGEDTVLIDTGAGGETWIKKLTDLGVKPESIKLILLTHFHGDHIGGLFQGNARRFSNAKVLASTPEYDSKGAPFEKIKSAYGEYFAKFNFGEEVFANSLIRVTAMDASGHTPGHSAFLLESKLQDKDKLLIIGDLLHAATLQFPAPEACASFDRDPEKSIVARKRVLDFAAQKKILIGGMHLPPPSVGLVTKEEHGYSFDLKQ